MVKSVRRAVTCINKGSSIDGLDVEQILTQASLRNCINCVHCDNHFFISVIDSGRHSDDNYFLEKQNCLKLSL